MRAATTSVKLRKRALSGNRERLYLDIRFNGARSFEFFDYFLYKSPKRGLAGENQRRHNTETLRLAESIQTKRLLALQSGRHGETPLFKRSSSFLEYYTKLATDKPAKDKTRQTWKWAIGHLATFVKEQGISILTFEHLSANFLTKYRTYLLDNLSTGSALLYFATLKSALAQAVRDDILLTNPASKLKSVKRPTPEPKFLTEKEIEKLARADYSHAEIRRAFFFALSTGLRQSDVIGLTWSQVDLDAKTVNIRQLKTSDILTLPLNDTAIKLLLGTEREQSGKVFTLPARQHIHDGLKIWFKRAGIEKRAHFHLSRHTFASLLINGKTDLFTLSKLLGHREVRSTQIYSHLFIEKQRQAVNSLSAINFERD